MFLFNQRAIKNPQNQNPLNCSFTQMNFYNSQHYTSFEAFYQDAFRWNLEFKKLSKGPFTGYIGLIDIGDIQVGEIKLNSRIEQSGISPRGFRTFVIPGGKEQSFKWLNYDVTGKDLLIFSKQGDLEAVSSDNFHHYMISIHEDLLDDIIMIQGLVLLEKNLDSNEKVIQLNRGYFINVQSFLEVIFRKLEVKPYLIDSASFLHNIRNTLPRILLGFCEGGGYVIKSPLQRNRDKVFAKFRGYLKVNSLMDISVTHLTEYLDVSERTVQYAFLERYGVTPKSYLNALKLNEVRKLLIDPYNKEYISNVARKSGFNHPGQFSIDYKKLFGESPSTTVSNARDHHVQDKKILH